MKKMNNIYEAPKAEVIELNVCRDLMQASFGDSGTNAGAGMGTTGTPGSY